MRKFIGMSSIIIILGLVLTGCGNGRLASNNNKPNSTSTDTAQQTGNAPNQTPKTNATNPQPDTNNSASKTSGSSTSSQASAGPAIVAKSENIISSSDKAELLNQVDKELDSLFNSINNLDDAKDEDLDLNQK